MSNISNVIQTSPPGNYTRQSVSHNLIEKQEYFWIIYQTLHPHVSNAELYFRNT